jgi:hypothetical protein
LTDVFYTLLHGLLSRFAKDARHYAARDSLARRRGEQSGDPVQAKLLGDASNGTASEKLRHKVAGVSARSAHGLSLLVNALKSKSTCGSLPTTGHAGQGDSRRDLAERIGHLIGKAHFVWLDELSHTDKPAAERQNSLFSDKTGGVRNRLANRAQWGLFTKHAILHKTGGVCVNVAKGTVSDAVLLSQKSQAFKRVCGGRDGLRQCWQNVLTNAQRLTETPNSAPRKHKWGASKGAAKICCLAYRALTGLQISDLALNLNKVFPVLLNNGGVLSALQKRHSHRILIEHLLHRPVAGLLPQTVKVAQGDIEGNVKLARNL